MTGRACIRGCVVEGVHFATCSDFDGKAGTCRGCAPVEARDGVMVCDRCYGRLLRRLEAVPDLVAHLRSIADPLKAAVYDRVLVSGSGSTEAPAPVSADLLDATTDIMHVIAGPRLAPGAASDVAYRHALLAVAEVLDTYDDIANDRAAFLEWWRLIMSASLEDYPEFWTVTRALSRWPLEDRRKWASQPCPECGLRAVKITPPRHRYSRTWFVCEKCGWRKTERDDDGLWAAAFGQYAEQDRHDEGSPNMGETKKFEPKDIDLTEPIMAGIRHVIENAETVAKIGDYGVPTAAVAGAVPVLAEQFAQLADDMARHVREHYQHGDLMAGGARLVAAAIRSAVQGGLILDSLVAETEREDELAEGAAEPDEPVEAAA